MSQPRSAEAAPSGALAAEPAADPAPTPRNRQVAWPLIALVAIPLVLALTLTGLWATNATRSADAYGQVGRLAALGQQVNGLAQAMADERSSAAAFISGGRPAAGIPALRRQYAITDGQAARVRRLISRLGHGYPAQTRAGAAQVMASIAKLPGLRRQATQSQASALAVIAGYSAATAGLFPVSDGIADVSGNSTLITSVRALGSLSRMIDHAAQQQAILSAALAEGRFAPGALAALTVAQARQASDLASFRNSATPEESQALTETLARPPARQAQAVEQRAIAVGNGALALGPQASQQWSAGMSYTVGWMRQAEQQLAGWVTADAQALHRNAMRSALITGVAVLGALALLVLGTVFAARSMMRRQRRPEPAALEDAEAPLALSAGAVPFGFLWRNHALLERLIRLIDRSELHEDDPERLANLFKVDHLATRIWRNSDSALVLAGHETRRPAEPLALVDVLRAAVSEIEEYRRVVLDTQHGVYVSGSAATDTVHLLAELMENATTFSPETAHVIVSGHAVYGGGALITISDGGTGLSEEELTLLNEQLTNPSHADMTAAPRMGLYAVALLAARHGITVTMSTPPDGGTTAEVYLPAALISLNAEPGWRGRAGEASMAGASEESGAGVADLPFSVLRSTSRPEPPLRLVPDTPEAVPALLGAPLPAPAPETSTGVPEPEPASADPSDGPPIFEAVRSGYLYAFGRDLPRYSKQQVGQSPAGQPARPPGQPAGPAGQPAKPAGQPARPPASWGDGGGRAMTEPPTAGPPAFSGLPQRIPLPGQVRGAAVEPEAPQPGQVPGAAVEPEAPQPGQVRGAAVDRETPPASAVEAAEIAWRQLASFQRGSRRAHTVARMNRIAKHPGQDA